MDICNDQWGGELTLQGYENVPILDAEESKEFCLYCNSDDCIFLVLPHELSDNPLEEGHSKYQPTQEDIDKFFEDLKGTLEKLLKEGHKIKALLFPPGNVPIPKWFQDWCVQNRIEIRLEMRILGESLKLAGRIKKDIDLNNLPLDDEYYYASLPLCVIDAVFSIGVNYKSVEKTIENYTSFFKIPKIRDPKNVLPPKNKQESIKDFIKKYDNHTPVEFASKIYKNRQRTSTTSGILKAKAVYDFACVLAKHNINYFQDFQNLKSYKQLEADIKKVKGQKSGISFDYFVMLAGSDNFVKPDRMIIRYIENAIGRSAGSEQKALDEARLLLPLATAILKRRFSHLTPRLVDHALWQFQRQIPKAQQGLQVNPKAHSRKAISGLFLSINDNRPLSDIANESVVKVNVVYSDGAKHTEGTAFLYKQIINEETNTSRLFFLTNLHVIHGAFFGDIFGNLWHNIFIGGTKNVTQLDPHITISWQRNNGSEEEIERRVSKVYIPKDSFLKFGIDLKFTLLDFAIIPLDIPTSETFNYFGMNENPDMKQGYKIYAFGYPVGYELTMSDGIMSHVYSCDDADPKRRYAIQHNVLINRGNSGGPLVTANGQIVGINTKGEPDAIGINFSLRTDCITEFVKNKDNIQLMDIEALVQAVKQKLLSDAQYSK